MYLHHVVYDGVNDLGPTDYGHVISTDKNTQRTQSLQTIYSYTKMLGGHRTHDIGMFLCFTRCFSVFVVEIISC